MEEENIWGEWLTTTLECNGISKRKFCKDVGISRDTMRRWCSGKSDVRLSTITKALDYLGYDLVFRKEKT